MFGFRTGYYQYLLIAALLPAVVLMVLIYRQDRIEREPVGLLFKLFVLGAVSTVPASLFEGLSFAFLDVVLPNPYSILYGFLAYFVFVAVTEEGLKRLFLQSAWRHPAFNYRFDGVVYGTAVALGFAAMENILYVFSGGIGVAKLRAVTAVPIHAICGIFMGHFYGMAKACERYGMRGQQRMYQMLSILVPVLIHGFYDFSVTSRYGILQIFFVVFLLILYIVTILSVRKYAREDIPL